MSDSGNHPKECPILKEGNDVTITKVEKEETKSAFERHAQTGIQAILVLLLVWVGNTSVDSRDRLSRLEERIHSQQTTIVELQHAVKLANEGRLSRQDLRSEFERYERNVDEIRQRLSELEKDVLDVMRPRSTGRKSIKD